MAIAIVVAFAVLGVIVLVGDGARAWLPRRRHHPDQPRPGAIELLRRPLRSRYPK